MKLPLFSLLLLLPLLSACAGQPTGVALGLGTHGGGVAVYSDSAYYSPSHSGVYLGLPVFGGGDWERGSVSPRVARPVTAPQEQGPLPAGSEATGEAPSRAASALPAAPQVYAHPASEWEKDSLPMAVVSRQTWSRLEREYRTPLTLGHVRLPAALR